MCKLYAQIKDDFLYRGDVLDAVPFVSLDPGEIAVERKTDPSLFDGHFEREADPAACAAPRLCAARLERLPGLVVSRTCETNKFGKAPRKTQVVHVAPIRPFLAFPAHHKSGKPFHEMVLEGFKAEEGDDGESGQCYRFLVLNPCAEHGLPDGGLVCFREMQPVPIRHALAARKITRLSRLSVGALAERVYRFFEQTEQDYENDEAPVGEPSPIVANFRKRNEKAAERAASLKTEI